LRVRHHFLKDRHHLPIARDIPAEVCDCHVHVVAPVERFPQAAGRTFTASPATLATLRAASGPQGVTHFVIVQPSFYAQDNAYLLEALAALGERGRGVAVLGWEAISPALLGEYRGRGVCGLRLNLYSPRGGQEAIDLDNALDRLARQLPGSGWHAEVIAPLPVLLASAPRLANSPVPIVIDHYGLPGRAAPDSADGCRLLDLVRLPHIWVKLSAPYRIVADPLATVPPRDWLDAMLRVAPDRCVWGSDWPHTPEHGDHRGPRQTVPYRKIEYSRLLDDFVNALPDPALVPRVLWENPARLYRFGRD
jgi:predicted TIM-barrel fold metal-dependent hydrolase